jgi:hypothetical protein
LIMLQHVLSQNISKKRKCKIAPVLN